MTNIFSMVLTLLRRLETSSRPFYAVIKRPYNAICLFLVDDFFHISIVSVYNLKRE